MSVRYLGGGRKLDLGPGAPTARPAYSVGGRLVSDPLALGVGRVGSTAIRGFGNQRPTVWQRMRGGPNQ